MQWPTGSFPLIFPLARADNKSANAKVLLGLCFFSSLLVLSSCEHFFGFTFGVSSVTLLCCSFLHCLFPLPNSLQCSIFITLFFYYLILSFHRIISMLALFFFILGHSSLFPLSYLFLFFWFLLSQTFFPMYSVLYYLWLNQIQSTSGCHWFYSLHKAAS